MGIRSTLSTTLNCAEATITTTTNTVVKTLTLIEESLDQAHLELKALRLERAQELTAQFKKIKEENPTLMEDLEELRNFKI